MLFKFPPMMATTQMAKRPLASSTITAWLAIAFVAGEASNSVFSNVTKGGLYAAVYQ